MKLPPFEYACPTSLNEAVALLASHDGEAKPLAGGQSLMPMMAFRVAQPTLLVDLRKLSDLRGIRIGADGVRLGALVRSLVATRSAIDSWVAASRADLEQMRSGV